MADLLQKFVQSLKELKLDDLKSSEILTVFQTTLTKLAKDVESNKPVVPEAKVEIKLTDKDLPSQKPVEVPAAQNPRMIEGVQCQGHLFCPYNDILYCRHCGFQIKQMK